MSGMLVVFLGQPQRGVMEVSFFMSIRANCIVRFAYQYRRSIMGSNFISLGRIKCINALGTCLLSKSRHVGKVLDIRLRSFSRYHNVCLSADTLLSCPLNHSQHVTLPLLYLAPQILALVNLAILHVGLICRRLSLAAHTLVADFLPPRIGCFWLLRGPINHSTLPLPIVSRHKFSAKHAHASPPRMLTPEQHLH
jgi:hypothetical protein